jgi:Flp pilus assembly protein TadG
MVAAGRRGQAAVFVALCLMGLLLVVAFSTNIGVLVNDRIRMQETADLATYAAAYSEADSLNDLTKLNQGIAAAAKECRSVLENGGMPWATTPCNCGNTDIAAEAAWTVCQADIDAAIYDFVERAQYDMTVDQAMKVGKATAKANFSKTEDKTSFMDDIPGSPTLMGVHWITWSTSTWGGASPSLADFRQVENTAFNYRVQQFCNSYCTPTAIVFSPTYTTPTWFYKETRDPDVWVAGRSMGTPRKRFLDVSYTTDPFKKDGGYFGASSTGGDDVLIAYAVAKPYDGSVGPSEQSGLLYDGNLPSSSGVWAADGIDYPRMTMLDEYRARMAGIQDGLDGPADPKSIIEIDGAMLGKTWDVSRFEH